MRRRDVSNRDVASKSAAKGRVLCQLEEDIDVDRCGDGEESSALEVSPITVYETAYVEAQLRMIAVNDNFICYGIRNGLIRVFSRKSGNVRSLLRGHSDSISTLKFLSNTDVLLSVDVQGRVIVRKLTLQGAGSDDGPESSVDDTAAWTIESQNLVDFDFQVNTPDGHLPPAACWLPLDSRRPGTCEL